MKYSSLHNIYKYVTALQNLLKRIINYLRVNQDFFFKYLMTEKFNSLFIKSLFYQSKFLYNKILKFVQLFYAIFLDKIIDR